MADEVRVGAAARQDVVLDAVGNPTRRAVLRLLRDGERTVRELTDALPVTQSAVSQHLKHLSDAGLVRARAEGTRRLYSVQLDGLAEVLPDGRVAFVSERSGGVAQLFVAKLTL